MAARKERMVKSSARAGPAEKAAERSSAGRNASAESRTSAAPRSAGDSSWKNSAAPKPKGRANRLAGKVSAAVL